MRERVKRRRDRSPPISRALRVCEAPSGLTFIYLTVIQAESFRSHFGDKKTSSSQAENKRLWNAQL